MKKQFKNWSLRPRLIFLQQKFLNLHFQQKIGTYFNKILTLTSPQCPCFNSERNLSISSNWGSLIVSQTVGKSPQMKDLYIREGKGRHCFLGDRISSIPCRNSFFAPGRFEEQAALHQDELIMTAPEVLPSVDKLTKLSILDGLVYRVKLSALY